MAIQPISVNLYQSLLPARKLSNSKGLKKKRFLLNGFPESEKDRYFIAFKGKLMTEKPKLPCIRGRFVLLQVQEEKSKQIYYLWANRNSLIKRLELDRKALPKTWDYTSLVLQKIPKKEIKEELPPEKPTEEIVCPVNEPPKVEEPKKEEITIDIELDPEELAHTEYLRGGRPTVDSKKRMEMAFEIAIHIFSLIPRELNLGFFQEGINPFFPNYGEPNKQPVHLVSGLALELNIDDIQLTFHTPFGAWTLPKLGHDEFNSLWGKGSKLWKNLGVELYREKNNVHIYRITRWKEEKLDRLGYMQINEKELDSNWDNFQKAILQVARFPINGRPPYDKPEKNKEILLDLIDQERQKNEAEAKKERAKVHTAWIQGGKITEESKKRMKIAYEIAIYYFSLNATPYLDPLLDYKPFITGISPSFPINLKKSNPDSPQHLVKGLALEGDGTRFRLHTPFGEWQLCELEKPELFEKLRVKLGLEHVQEPKFRNPLYAIRKWKREALEELEYTAVDSEDVDLRQALNKIKPELDFPGIDGPDKDNSKNLEILINLVDQERNKKL